MKIMNLVNSIDVPWYWVFSTKQHFKEFWSKETIFLKQLNPLANVAPQQNFGEQGQGTSTVDHTQATRISGYKFHKFIKMIT